MNTSTRHPHSRLDDPRKQGMAIATVLILLVGASIIMGSILRFSANETRLNRNQEIWLEAKLTAEGLAEYGFAELRRRFDSNNAFPEDALLPKVGSNPIVPPADFYNFYNNWYGSYDNNTRVVMPANPYDPMQPWGTYDTEIIAGIVPKGEWKFIDPNVPGNETDKLRGRLVFVRGIALYTKATIRDQALGIRQTAYSSQELQVRDAPLFSHAIFYNMDMEIAPGPQMDVVGAVHVNGDLYVQAGNSLEFYDQVTISGDLYHGRNPASGKSDDNGAVRIVDAAGNLQDMYDGSQWLESSVTNFAELASSRWQGNLMTGEHHVEPKLLVDIPDYVADDPDTAAANDALNYGHSVIATASNQSAVADVDAEQQKYAYKAGLTMKVDTASGTYQLVTYERDASGNVIYNAGTGEPNEIILDDSADPIAQVNLFASSGSGSSETVLSGIRDKRRNNKAVDLVEVDVGKLRTLVHNNNEAEWGGASNQRPDTWWNGVVYVEFPEQPDPGRKDGIVPSVDGWGLKLTNGSQIPNPSFAHSNSIYGTTFATNNVMYVQGHFNADGDPNTGTSTDPDVDSVLTEPPAALAADAINILSSNWDDAYSGRSKGDRQAAFTEFSAAILTGLVPSGKTGASSYSGGTENFPRFLESWSGDTLRMRGSIVSLFESEIATEPWGSSDVYDAPNRDWGFHSKLREGYYPPGTPNTRTYRRIDFKDLTADEYNAALAFLQTNYLSGTP